MACKDGEAEWPAFGQAMDRWCHDARLVRGLGRSRSSSAARMGGSRCSEQASLDRRSSAQQQRQSRAAAAAVARGRSASTLSAGRAKVKPAPSHGDLLTAPPLSFDEIYKEAKRRAALTKSEPHLKAVLLHESAAQADDKDRAAWRPAGRISRFVMAS
eukprot:TRINITY_DN21911_c0_g1_i1.p1 TRINITY_DN21911_c0_g1~~TRINITY_DN21911_c0_g1_i1.p1  ORF type:complete len:158 (-),score=22.35 TRINITY_DN21911_c0_g1_i1:177-650(-)